MTNRTQPDAREFTMSQYASKDSMIGAMRERIAELESELEAICAGGVQALSAAPEAFLNRVIALCTNRGSSPENIEAWDKDDKWIADLWRQAEAMLAASHTPPAEQPPRWVERWHGSGGKEFWEGWSILNAANREMIAHLGPDVDPDAVRDIVAAHNASLCGECAGTGGRWCPACAGATPPAEQQAKDSYIKLLADCRDAFPVPEHGSPIENEWIAAVGSHEAVPAYLQAVAKQQAITPETGNSVSAQGAAITSESGKPPAEQQATSDPLDWPLPCDITVGGVTIGKGCPLRTVQTRLEVQAEANALLMRHLSREQAAPKAAPVVAFEDARVQVVYNILVDDEAPPVGEHWEGFIARRIVDALAAPKAAPGDALDEVMRERDEAEDFINELLDEVLGADRLEWSSAYNRYDAMSDVRERITALHKPAVDKAWDRLQSAKAAPQQEAQEPCGWAVYDSLGFYELHDTEAGAKSFCGHYNKRPIDPKKPYTYRAHFTAPQPAPAPLSDDVVKDAARWRLVETASSEVTLRLHNLRPDRRAQYIDAAIAAQGGKV